MAKNDSIASDTQVLTHTAFDRPPVLNARRRGSTPRDVPMLNRERRQRAQKSRHEAQRTPTPEERIAEYEATINEVAYEAAYHLLMAIRAIKKLPRV
ncbi:hypothetical protein [Paraburkholderia tuberum]|uniref:Uncharacterized protein n=1 Tax=Paraburkholderia tuberum TaxID=157910 RepID=A0A1H0ZNV1_9BURK|nr:hypothetical protein [Paraburkholderia tuberum]SDQ29034.1 hypothetical protein SAMN05445850_0139 [Paraburkholderia tuberum]